VNKCIITGPPNGPVRFARGRLSSSSVVVCNAAGGRAGRPPGPWTVGEPATGRVGGRAANTVGPIQYTAGQYGYVPLRRHLVITIIIVIIAGRLETQTLTFKLFADAFVVIEPKLHTTQSSNHSHSSVNSKQSTMMMMIMLMMMMTRTYGLGMS